MLKLLYSKTDARASTARRNHGHQGRANHHNTINSMIRMVESGAKGKAMMMRHRAAMFSDSVHRLVRVSSAIDVETL